MARPATAGEFTSLRSGNQFSQVYAAIHKPAIVFKALVNQTFTTNDGIAEITYDTVTVGAYTDILPGMTMYIGSSNGAYDKGMVRIRKAPTSTKIYIGETSEIDWADNDYITVVNEFGLWQRHLKIDADGVIYMDYDVTYSNQHASCDPVPVLGPPLVLWLLTSAVTVTLDASASWCIGSTITGYSWTAPGGNLQSGNTATPILTYNSTGQYRISCTVTAANGKTATGYRNVFVYSNSFLPPRVRITKQPSGNYDTGGWSFGIVLDDDADLTDVRERVQVILFSRDWYGGTEGAIGPVVNAERVIAVGWITGESINWNPVAGAVEFEVAGPHAWLEKMTGYPVGLEDTTFADNGGGDPNRWTEMKQLTVNKVIWHFLHWRTTATMVLDIFANTDTRQAARIPAPEASLWRQLVAMLEATILARPIVDRYGRLFCDVDIQLVPVADRSSIPVVMDITKPDWSGEIDIERRIVPDAGMVRVTGVHYLNGDFAALGAASPGQVLSHYGQIHQFDGLMLGDQDDTNLLAGLIAGKINNVYPMFPIRLGANNRLIDIAPHQYMTITVASGDTIRGITLTDVNIIPRLVTFNFNQETGFMETELECEVETQELPAAPITFPGGDGGPPIEPPEDPPLPPDPPDPEPIEEAGDGKAVVCTSSVVYYTEDFRATSPTWVDKTGDISGEVIVDADLRAIVGGFNMFVLTEDSVWFSKTVDQATPTWSKMFDLAAAGYTGLRIKYNNTKYSAGVLCFKPGVGQAYEIRFLFTQNNGLTWTDNFVKSDTVTGLEYHIEQLDFQIDKTDNDHRAWYATVADRPPAGDATYNPWAIAFQHMGSTPYALRWALPSEGIGLPAGLDSSYINDNMGGASVEAADVPRWFPNQLLSPAERTAVEAYLTSVYGTKGTDWYQDTTPDFSNPYDANATRLGIALGTGAPGGLHDVRVLALWRRYNTLKVASIDFGAHNGSRVYVGFKDTVLTSEDAGKNWTTYLASVGAYDLESHAAQPWGNHDITILSHAGNLNRVIDADVGPSFLAETAKMTPLRIVSDPENVGWPIMVLENKGGETFDLVEVTETGDTVLFTTRTRARSLRYGYGLTRAQRWIYFVDQNDIWFSDDGGVNFTSQNGSWAAYENGIIILPVTMALQQS